ncbi:MAG: dehydrogenase, partial [Nocardioidaceae bacterium]|nr:dehydrogenase [Nocardioidaceae bacterium]
YDAVFDPAILGEALAGHVTEGGHVVGVQPSAPRPVIPGATVDAVGVRPDGPGLADLLQRAAEGRLSTRVAGEFSLDDVTDALAALDRPGTRGRWVVVPG